MVKTCPECQFKNSDGTQECVNCGHEFSGTREERAQDNIPEPSENTFYTEERISRDTETKNNKLTCSECGELIEEEWSICPYCGNDLTKDLAKFCPDCGSEIQTDFKFCPNCGYDDLNLEKPQEDLGWGFEEQASEEESNEDWVYREFEEDEKIDKNLTAGEKIKKIFSLAKDVSTNPTNSFQNIFEGEISVPSPLLAYIIAAFGGAQAMFRYQQVDYTSWSSSGGYSSYSYSSFRFSPLFTILNLIFTLILAPLVFFLLHKVFKKVGGAMNGHGGAKSCKIAVGYGYAPFILFMPLSFLLQLSISLSPSLAFGGLGMIYTLLLFIFSIWALITTVIGIREAHEFSTGKAFGTYIVGGIAVAIVIIPISLVYSLFMIYFI